MLWSKWDPENPGIQWGRGSSHTGHRTWETTTTAIYHGGRYQPFEKKVTNFNNSKLLNRVKERWTTETWVWYKYVIYKNNL